jgi:histidinol dehydrogenase
LRWFASGAAAFREALEEAERRGRTEAAKVGAAVAEIIARVRDGGDAALAHYTERFDGFDLRKRGFAASPEEIDGAWRRTPADLREALARAAARIDAFHRHQRDEGFTVDLAGGIVGQRVLPVARAGIYVPGGKAAYPSTLLMNAIPARVAGVGETAAACAAPGGEIPDIVLAAARVAGLSAVFRIGGAQAIAAFAFGTESVPKTDVVAGPGNAYVTEAKRQVYGVVGIDMLAGPSELVVLADRTAEPAYVAADLLSQAEHDEDAFLALVTDSEAIKDAVEAALRTQAAGLPRREILDASLSRAVGFLVSGREEGIATVNRLAPEHLSIMMDDPWGALEGIRNAGTAFLGPHSPVAVGDYIAGINHTLPTGGAARFSSPLGVGTFLKRTNVVSYQLRLLAEDAPHVVALARKEGLIAHAQAVLVRTGTEEG